MDEPLLSIVQRLTAAPAEDRYSDIGTLLEDLERAKANVPPNNDVWERLLALVRDHSSGVPEVRRSA